MVVGMRAEESTATLSFADKAQRTSISTSQQIWKQDGITFTNNKSKSTSSVADYANPVRLYKNSEIIVEYSSPMSKIAFNCNTAAYATSLGKSLIGTDCIVSEKVVTVKISPASTNFTISALSDGQVRLNSLTVYYVEDDGEVTPSAPETPILTPSCSFLETQKVTISCSTDGATIYYTTDGSEPTPEKEVYSSSSPLEITTTTTVRAIAVNENGASEIAEATYTKIEAMGIAEAKKAYDEARTDTEVFINLENAVVTVNEGDYLFIQDGTAGINLYRSGATYAAGTKFTEGVLSGISTAYKEMHQITNATFSDVVTTTTTVVPLDVPVADLNDDYAAYEGRYVKLTDVTLEGTSITQGEDSYDAYDRFGLGFAAEYSTPTVCDIEGVVACYGTTLQIFPVVITVKEAVLPQVSPAGGEDAENALTIDNGTEITITPVESNTVTYSINGAESIAITEETTVTANKLGEMTLSVTSTFGKSSKTANYYYNVIEGNPKIVATLTREEIESTTKTTGYSATALVNSSIGLWSGYMAVNYQYGTNIQINKKEGYHIQSPVFPGRVISVAVTFNASTSQSSARGFVVMPSSFEGESASDATKGCLGSASYEGKDNPTATTAELTGDVTSFKIYATGGAIYVAGIEVVYEKPKDHTLTVGETGWATLYLGLDATIPTGVECYTVTSAANGVSTLSLVEKNLPAHMGVVVKANANTSHTFAYKSTYAGKGAIENLLQGSIVDAEITGNGYVLSAPEGVVGLYAAKLTDGKFLNNANKAYLPASAVASNAPMFSFSRGGDEEDTTGIEYSSPLNSMPSTAIYDLTGRRVEKMEKGIYIVNGKKVIR